MELLVEKKGPVALVTLSRPEVIVNRRCNGGQTQSRCM